MAPASQSQPIAYGHTIGGPGWQTGVAIDTDAAGNVYVLGQLAPPNGTPNNLIVAKFDPTGALIWQRMLTFDVGMYPIDLVVDASGDAFFDGTTNPNGTGAHVGFLAELTSDGSLGFAEQFPMLPNGLAWDAVTSNVIVTGDGVGGYGNGFVASFSASGTLSWMRSVGVNVSASAWGAAVDAAGDIFVTLDRPALSEAALAEFSGTGSVLTQRRLTQLGFPAYTWDVGVSPGGTVFFVGFDYSRFVPIVAGFNETLVPEWSAFVNDSALPQQFYRVAAHPDGTVYAVGSYENNTDFAQGTSILHVAANGTLISDNTYDSYSLTGSFRFVDAGVGTDGSLLLAGSSTGVPSRDEQTEGGVHLTPTPGLWVLESIPWSANTTTPGSLTTTVSDPGYPVDDFSVGASSQVWWGAVGTPSPALNVSVAATLPPRVPANRTVNFTSTVSGGSSPYAYRWSFGDGNFSTAADPVHTYAQPGDYPVQLWVNDSLGDRGYNYTLVSMLGPPVINYFYTSPNVTYTYSTVSFYASATDPNGGSITNYHFDFGDYSSTDSIYGYAYHNYYALGTFLANLTVTESEGPTASATAVVQILDNPPYACMSVYPNPALTGQNVSFNSCSWDPDGYITTWAWNFGDGNTSGGSNGSGALASHAYAKAGTYTVTLNVTDNANMSSSTNQSETVYVNTPPTANFTYQVLGAGNVTPLAPGPNQTIQFDGSSSAAHNPGSYLQLWAWDFGDGVRIANFGYPWAYHAYSVGGRSYPVTLTVYDSYGVSNYTTKDLYVDMPPTAAITTPSAFAKVGTPFLVNGSASSDSDGTVRRWDWTFGDGGTGSGAVATHVYVATGVYAVTLQVFDNNNLAGTASITVSVVEPKSPTAILAFSPSRPAAGDAVAFNATRSLDPDGRITGYTWQFGDGATGSGAVATHVYGAPGTYTVILTIVDEDGIAASTTTTIAVISRPVAAFLVSPSTPQSGDATTFSAQGSSDLSGQLTYTWSFGDGSYGAGWLATHTYAQPGTYVVTLTVTNVYGVNATATESVVVVAPTPPGILSPAVASGLGWLAVGLAAGAAIVGVAFYLLGRRRRGGSAPPPST